MITELFDKAYLLASRLHRNQIRKVTGVPYITHLLSVASLVLENGGSEEVGAAALLHDSAEDQGGEQTLQTIATEISPRVADLVRDLSDSLVDTTLGTEKDDWQGRKRLYLENLPHHSQESQLISLCDKIHNLEGLVMALQTQGPKAWEFFKGKKEGTIWYFRELNKIFHTLKMPVNLMSRWDELMHALEEEI